MSAAPSLKTTYPWPADVLAYATKFNVAAHLEPLRQVTLRQFPTARSLRVYLEVDPEIRDLTFLVFEVSVPRQDVPHYVAAKRQWHDAFYGRLPRPRQCPFVLSLRTPV
jgi:hypothetical protein